jgi:hypothetical protein
MSRIWLASDDSEDHNASIFRADVGQVEKSLVTGHRNCPVRARDEEGREAAASGPEGKSQIYLQLRLGIPLSILKAKDVPLHATKALGERGGIAPTHYRPRY